MENIAKSTSYGCYLDCDFETAKYPDDKTHIVGLLAEYVYDLEQRILHYDERYIKLWNEIETLRECVSKEFDQEQKIADLEANLAEKDKEIAYLTKQAKRFNNEAQKYFEDAYCNDFHNQDKISFAVEVLKIAQDYVQQYVNNFDDMNDCLCAIDNQIKRLTHQHKDKGE